MGKKIRLTLLLVVVFVVGIGVGLFGSSFLWHRFVLAPLTSNSLTDIAIDAWQLREGDADKVLKRKLMALPPITRSYYEALMKYMPNDNSRYISLWYVQKYYEVSGDEIPAEIKPILDSLPPRPPLTCSEQRRLEQAQQGTQETKD